MAVEKTLIKKAIDTIRVKEFLERALRKAGFSQVIIQKTPIATRITLYVRRPGVVVGKGGGGVRELCEVLEKRFGIESPQLDVIEVENPSLDANLVAEKIAKQIEVKGKVKQVMRSALREIMEAGAIGAEIRVAGKVIGKGGKAKALSVRQGYLKKSGDLVKLVREGRYVAYPKAGAIGVRVRIVPPGVVFPDRIELPPVKKEEVPVVELPPEEIPEDIPVEVKEE
jgi:small subunit ribosomal protein S3